MTFIVYLGLSTYFVIFYALWARNSKKIILFLHEHIIPGITGDDGDYGQGPQRAVVRGHDKDRVPRCGSLHITHGRQCRHAERGRVFEGFPVCGFGAGHGVA